VSYMSLTTWETIMEHRVDIEQLVQSTSETIRRGNEFLNSDFTTGTRDPIEDIYYMIFCQQYRFVSLKGKRKGDRTLTNP